MQAARIPQLKTWRQIQTMLMNVSVRRRPLACSSKPITEKKKRIVGCQLYNALIGCTEVDYYASMEVSWRLHLILRGRGIMGCEHWGYPYSHWEQFLQLGPYYLQF